MYWVAWKGYNGGKALSLGILEQYEADTLGFHGYPTEAQAEANPNTVNNPAQKLQVNAWVFNTQSLAQHTANAANRVIPGAKAVTGAITDVNSFLSRLTSVNTWIRVAEVLLGAMLIMAGALKLSGSSADLGDIAKTATKVIK